MSRALRHLILCLLLLLAQQAALAHSLTHLRPRGDDKSVPASHAAAQCLVFHAVDSAMPNASPVPEPARLIPPPPSRVALPFARSPRIEFDSRAPPTV